MGSFAGSWQRAKTCWVELCKPMDPSYPYSGQPARFLLVLKWQALGCLLYTTLGNIDVGLFSCWHESKSALVTLRKIADRKPVWFLAVDGVLEHVFVQRSATPKNASGLSSQSRNEKSPWHRRCGFSSRFLIRMCFHLGPTWCNVFQLVASPHFKTPAKRGDPEKKQKRHPSRVPNMAPNSQRTGNRVLLSCNNH